MTARTLSDSNVFHLKPLCPSLFFDCMGVLFEFVDLDYLNISAEWFLKNLSSRTGHSSLTLVRDTGSLLHVAECRTLNNYA